MLLPAEDVSEPGFEEAPWKAGRNSCSMSSTVGIPVCERKRLKSRRAVFLQGCVCRRYFGTKRCCFATAVSALPSLLSLHGCALSVSGLDCDPR